MLVCCRKHVRAFCRISISELRRVAPSAFSYLMVVSLLLADGLFPVYASRYRTPASLYVSSNVASRANGVGSSDGVLSSRRSSQSNIRYRPKAKVKPSVSKREDSVLNGGMGSENSKLVRSHLHSQLDNRELSVSEGKSDRRNERGILEDKRRLVEKEEKQLNSYVEFSSRGDKISATSGSPSTFSSLKSFSPSSLSSSLGSSPFIISNSSNNLGDGGTSQAESEIFSRDFDNSCPDVPQFISLTPQEQCKSLVNRKENECVVLTANVSQTICNNCQAEDRVSIILKSKLRFCSSYDVRSVTCASNPSAGINCELRQSSSVCMDYLEEIIDSDDYAEKMFAGFLGLFTRYDCSSSYSVKWSCHHCKQAYKDWLCSQTIKFTRSAQVIPPCVEFCSHVEEMCPFFRPKLDSYAGDHSFICKDPHMNLPISDSEKNCYGLCDLWSRSQITEFYCSHANLRGNCPLLQKCDRLFQNESINPSNYSNISNSTSGSNSISRTPTLFILQAPVLVLTFFLWLQSVLTELQFIPEGFT